MRAIDADVLKQHIDKLPALPDGNFAGNHSALKALINMQPTIEPSTSCSEIPNSSDTISRQAAIDAVKSRKTAEQSSAGIMRNAVVDFCVDIIKKLPPAQPEIIYCKDCVKHNKGLGNYEVHPDGSSTWIWKDSACPLVSWRDKAQGHEFDYQFCAYAERREVTT